MPLIALIVDVEPAPRSCRITVDRPDSDDEGGATTLRILNPHWTPEVGMKITGGRDVAIITCGPLQPSHHYRRSGFSILMED